MTPASSPLLRPQKSASTTCTATERGMHHTSLITSTRYSSGYGLREHTKRKYGFKREELACTDPLLNRSRYCTNVQRAKKPKDAHGRYVFVRVHAWRLDYTYTCILRYVLIIFSFTYTFLFCFSSTKIKIHSSIVRSKILSQLILASCV